MLKIATPLIHAKFRIIRAVTKKYAVLLNVTTCNLA